MADLTPNNREEYWLQGMVDGQTTLEPNKRREYWYKEIVDAIGSGGGGGTGGGVLVVGATMNETTMTVTLDKTWKEIHDAPFAIIVINSAQGDMTYKANGFIGGLECDDGIYSVLTFMAGISQSAVSFDPVIFKATTENGYPVAGSPDDPTEPAA